MRRFSAASKQVLSLALLRNFDPEKNASDARNMVFLALLINWGGSNVARPAASALRLRVTTDSNAVCN